LRILIDLQSVFDFEEEWQRGVQLVSDGVRRGVQKAVDEGVREAINTRTYKDQTALLTSRIKGWVEISTPGGATGVLGAFTHYASYVNDGTEPHEIHGNPTLTFKGSNGQWVTVNTVERGPIKHPGYRGDGFMSRALHKAERVILREVELSVAQLQQLIAAE
jgi:hypothetical protein